MSRCILTWPNAWVGWRLAPARTGCSWATRAPKPSILTALAAVGSAGIGELATRIESEVDPRAGLRLFIEATLEAAAAGHPFPAALAAALPADQRVAMREHEEAAELLMVHLLQRGRDDGSFRADLDPGLDGRIVYRAIMGAHDLAATDGVDLERLTEHLYVDMLRITTEANAPGRRKARR